MKYSFNKCYTIGKINKFIALLLLIIAIMIFGKAESQHGVHFKRLPMNCLHNKIHNCILPISISIPKQSCIVCHSCKQPEIYP